MGDTTSVSMPSKLDLTSSNSRRGQEPHPAAWSVRMADTCIKQSPVLMNVWSYEWGVVLKGVEQVWFDTNDRKYLEYIQCNIEQFVEPDGNIRTYNLQEYNLDQINSGKLLFSLFQTTGDQRYQQALHLLRRQLQTQPRTSEGGFWHKNIYPYQMWLDGIYMAGPFYAQYATCFDEPDGLDDVAHQILLIERHTRDPKTGLFYHGWDESKMQKWANPQTGCSPNFWGRAMGWYAMALVDVLDFMPPSHQARDRIVTIFQRMIHSLKRVQDATTGLWCQILDQNGREGNYTEASASCMFVYAIAKGIRKGYLASEYLEVAQKGYTGIIEHLIEVDDDGLVNLTGICRVAGLGGAQQRDGSVEYYLSEPVGANDYKGVGPFILTSVEMERLSKAA